ncbi:MAG: PorT family protein, partial [Bacteroidales bacterium]|nr:PorT family protein [Bacteroidales bacterium]
MKHICKIYITAAIAALLPATLPAQELEQVRESAMEQTENVATNEKKEAKKAAKEEKKAAKLASKEAKKADVADLAKTEVEQSELLRQDTIDFNDKSEELRILAQDTSNRGVKKYKPWGMVGLRYGCNLSNMSFSEIKPKSTAVFIPNQYSLVLSYNNALWDMLDIFGAELAFKYGEEGYDSDYDCERFKIAEISTMAQAHLTFSRFRLLVNVGPYVGYRLSNNREDGAWNEYDNRFDYGIAAGLGLGLVFKPFEIHIEGGYKFALSSIYHVNKYSDEYWVLAYPRNIM